jgi:hypothetical protein
MSKTISISKSITFIISFVAVISVILGLYTYHLSRKVTLAIPENTIHKFSTHVYCTINPQNQEIAVVTPFFDDEENKEITNGTIVSFYQVKTSKLKNVTLEPIGYTSFNNISYNETIKKVKNTDCTQWRKNVDKETSYTPLTLTPTEQAEIQPQIETQEKLIEEGQKRLEYEKELPSKPVEEQYVYCLKLNDENKEILKAIKEGKSEYKSIPIGGINATDIELLVSQRETVCNELKIKLK